MSSNLALILESLANISSAPGEEFGQVCLVTATRTNQLFRIYPVFFCHSTRNAGEQDSLVVDLSTGTKRSA